MTNEVFEATINVAGFKNFADQLRKADKGLYLDFRHALQAALKPAVGTAKATEGLPKEVAATVKMSVTAKGALLKSGSKTIPGAAFEHGGRPGSFRHPVFGNRGTWVNQAAVPHLRPAAEKHMPEIRSAMVAAFRDAISNMK